MQNEQQSGFLGNSPVWGVIGLCVSALLAGLTGYLKRQNLKDERILELQARVTELTISLETSNDRLLEAEDSIIELAQKNNVELLMSHSTLRTMNEMFVQAMLSRNNDELPPSSRRKGNSS